MDANAWISLIAVGRLDRNRTDLRKISHFRFGIVFWIGSGQSNGAGYTIPYLPTESGVAAGLLEQLGMTPI